MCAWLSEVHSFIEEKTEYRNKKRTKIHVCVKKRKRMLEQERHKGVCRLPAPFYTPDFQGALREQLSPAVGALLG